MTYQEKVNNKAAEYLGRVPSFTGTDAMSTLGLRIMALQLLAAIADELHELNKSIKHRSESEE